VEENFFTRIRQRVKMWCLIAVLLVAGYYSPAVVAMLSEPDRVAQWRAQGNKWPPNWQPESEQYRELMANREAEIMSLTGTDERWGNWLQFTQSRLVPRLHAIGFAIVPIPSRAYSRLKAKLDDAVTNIATYPDEVPHAGSYYEKATMMVEVGKTLDDLQAELANLHVQFAGGLKLTQTAMYGMRVSREGSSAVMHYEPVS
jgi:hypothetical protein